jgi:predicted double-glycine peptidase
MLLSRLIIKNGMIRDKELEFPTNQQDNNATCGSAAVQAVLTYYGQGDKIDFISKALHTGENGTDYDKIIAFFKKLKFEVIAGRMTDQDLKSFVDKGIPVIVEIQAWRNDGHYTYNTYANGHYCVIIGYENNRFVMEDPALNNEKGYIPFEGFDVRWRGYGKTTEHLDNFGIAVIGKPVFKYNQTEEIL